jgi:uncharacterized protein YjbI with pentapeptide repeats
VWRWLHLDIWWPVPVLILMVAAALWFRGVELPAYQVASLPAGADPMTIGDATELLLVPLTLAVVAYVFSTYQRRQDREIAERERDNDREIARDRNEEAELQTYLDRMSELMLTHDLRPPSSSDDSEEQGDETKATAPHNSTASTIARARTLAVLRSIKSSVRKASVVQFLYESKLIHREGTVVDLRGADLYGANLRGANLRGANLSWADLRGADLRQANLQGADLRQANLGRANLGRASLEWANLEWANLQGASLQGTSLKWASLQGANMRGASLRGADLFWTSLREAKYNNATTPPPGGFPDDAIHMEKDPLWDSDIWVEYGVGEGVDDPPSSHSGEEQ